MIITISVILFFISSTLVECHLPVAPQGQEKPSEKYQVKPIFGTNQAVQVPPIASAEESSAEKPYAQGSSPKDIKKSPSEPIVQVYPSITKESPTTSSIPPYPFIQKTAGYSFGYGIPKPGPPQPIPQYIPTQIPVHPYFSGFGYGAFPRYVGQGFYPFSQQYSPFYPPPNIYDPYTTSYIPFPFSGLQEISAQNSLPVKRENLNIIVNVPDNIYPNKVAKIPKLNIIHKNQAETKHYSEVKQEAEKQSKETKTQSYPQPKPKSYPQPKPQTKPEIKPKITSQKKLESYPQQTEIKSKPNGRNIKNIKISKDSEHEKFSEENEEKSNVEIKHKHSRNGNEKKSELEISKDNEKKSGKQNEHEQSSSEEKQLFKEY